LKEILTVIRAPRLIAVVGLAALVLSGCGTVRAGAAATVGDHRITTSQLAAVVARGLTDPSAQQNVGTDKPAFERTVLGRMIGHLVLAQAAHDAGVSVDGSAVDAALASFAQQLGGPTALQAAATKAGIAPQDLRGVIADAALRDALADKLTVSIPVPDPVLRKAYQDGIAQYDRVHSAHILVANASLAQQLLAQVEKAPSTFAALAARYSLDTGSKASGGDLGFQGRGALAKPFEQAIFSAKPGTFVIAKTIYGYHVIHVIERQTTTFEQAVPSLRRTLLGTQRSDAVGQALVTTAKRLGVHVNPRFGSWDAATQAVDATSLCPSTAVSSPSPRADSSGGAPQPTASPAC
jgi:peptidyl-prolyl cis-trans isomerase C